MISPVRKLRSLSAVLLAFSGSGVIGCAHAATDFGEVSMYVANMLQNHHYLRKDFDDEMSSKTLEAYFKLLDFNKMYFTRQDIDSFREKYATTLDDRILLKDISAPKDIYRIYKERVTTRVKWVENYLKETKFTFDSDRTVDASREKSDWPADQAQADEIWKGMIEGDMLQEEIARIDKEERAAKRAAKADGKEDADKPKDKTPNPDENLSSSEKVLKRYTRFLESLEENDDEEIVNYFLSSMAAAYDPHSEYFSKSELDNFEISIQNRLIGIGALLEGKDGAVQITGLVVGGPAEKSGLLKINDRIVGVGQGEDGPMVDTLFMKLDKVVELIRGKENTIVRLNVQPANGDPNKEISIQRAEVPLKDKLATAEIIDMKLQDGGTRRIGWISIPSFYADMETGSVSMTADVSRLLERLKKEKVEGLVIDLRGNGGGSLDEAVKLTGLFTGKSPVVQAKDKMARITNRVADNETTAYDGPLAVLTDKTSASASEIFAAALQDDSRALILGDSSTFGKGTVQTVMDVSRFMPFFSDKKRAGALKLTIQKFYRIAGGSTQLKGVIPDIVFPDWKDAMDIGEAALDNPLPYDEIPSMEYTRNQNGPKDVPELKRLFQERITKDPEFQWIMDDTTRLKKRIDENIVSLNLKKRLEERTENKNRLEERRKYRDGLRAKYEEEHFQPFITQVLRLDNIDDQKLPLLEDVSEEDTTGMRFSHDDDDDFDKVEYLFKMDPTKVQSLHTLEDMIEVNSAPKPAEAVSAVEPQPARP